ncbi:murein transglycosylase A [Azorhizobium oxalatiphilum]|uniref:murein transglycosylase A n=1 Tax=Azorhizobium oxalatiphilum TaxID=980631 RepID=UPI001FCEF965|nr:MltA domain-containing protein [Azorhizobium oxalatiphilum]
MRRAASAAAALGLLLAGFAGSGAGHAAPALATVPALHAQPAPASPARFLSARLVPTRLVTAHLVPEPAVPGAVTVPVEFGDLPGWDKDDAAAAFRTFLISCRALRTPPAEIGPASNTRLLPGLHQACMAARALGTDTPSALIARLFFEANFRPFAIRPQDSAQGFLTGYYEPEVDGSRTEDAAHQVPVYARPPDLIPGNPGPQSNKGPAFRKQDGQLVPYWDRAAIEDGALSGKGLEVVWLKDPIDLFFMQIQGSARVKLNDGGVLRLNYDGHNGQPYVPVGRLLIQRGQVPREQMSMDRIRIFMESDPAAGKALRRENPSYVFFKAVPLADGEGALGAQGVGLTPGRSIAIDRHLHTYGTPFFISAPLPLTTEARDAPFQRLMIAQDTGSAIVGPARADLFFGAGDEAGRIAGRIRDSGDFFLLVPRRTGGAA